MEKVLDQIAKKIIQEQELIIGPLAWDEATKVPGLKVDLSKKEVVSIDDKPEAINQLIGRYERLFGRASLEVCKQAARPFINEVSADKIPSLLK